MKKNTRSILAIAMALILSLSLFAGCGAADTPVAQLASGGTLFLKVNPEIAVHYDADGNVTSVESRNADAEALLASYTGFEGRSTQDVVAELVTVIGEAGYFVEEIEGQRRQITIEIEPGSSLPSDTFLNDVADQVRTAVNAHDWTAPITMDDVTIYDDTDYGPGNDGITDYNDTDYGPNNDGVTDYTDYGTAATQPTGNTTTYRDTDYGPDNDGVTDYTDYGTAATQPAAQSTTGRTDYHHTDYRDTDYGTAPTAAAQSSSSKTGHHHTDYHDTDYNDSDYDSTDYH